MINLSQYVSMESRHLIAPIFVAPLMFLSSNVLATVVEPYRIDTKVLIQTQSGTVNDASQSRLTAYGDDLVNVPTESNLHSNGANNKADIDGRAFQNGNGISSLSYKGITYGGSDLFYYNSATSQIFYNVTNDSDRAQEIMFDFSLSNMRLTFNGVDQHSNPFVSGANIEQYGGGIALRFRVFLDENNAAYNDSGFIGPNNWADNYGDPLEIYGADFEAWTYFENVHTGYGIGLGRNRTFAPNIIPQRDILDQQFTSNYKINMDNISESLSLGFFAPGETKQLMVGARVEVMASDYEPIFEANFNDPNGFSPTFTASPVVNAHVPVPAAIWLFATGLGILGLSRRRSDVRKL